MTERLENVMDGIDGVPDMMLMSLPAVVIKEFRDRIKEQEYDKEEAETARDKYIDLYHVALQREREKDTELTALRKGEEKTKEVLHRQFAKVHKLQEGYEALRKERDELREYKLNVGLELANRMAHIEQLKKELAAALSEEGDK